ncbi:MAG: hypothetical protein OXU20_27760 [Myxococcales bacterium]|nr:hypothetical protein [Myxococcales bacterium]MDD9968452.1 hypothetical protein [Myxococcales bacterium]
MARQYDRNQVEEILRRAVRSEDGGDGVAHEDLVAAAAEVGIGEAALQRAVQDMEAQTRRAELLAAVKTKRRRRFFRMTGSYLVLALGMFALNHATGGDMWAHWVALALASVAAMRAVRVFMPSEDELERAVLVEERRSQRRVERAARRRRQAHERKETRRREAEFERLLARGVDILLRAADQKLSGLDSRPHPRTRVEESPEPDHESERPAENRRRGR